MLTHRFSTAIINTRGTGELQGPSIGFRTMTRDTLAQVSGGQTYNTNYVSAKKSWQGRDKG